MLMKNLKLLVKLSYDFMKKIKKPTTFFDHTYKFFLQ